DFLEMQIASQENLAPYMVFSDATLKDIASRIPLTIDEFEDITGVGKHKLDTYGEIFLNLTQGFEMMREGDFIYRVVKTKPKKKKKNGPKKDTVMESVQLYWAGKTLEEISEIRALKTDTILTHLGKRYVSHKDVDLNAHLSSEEVKEIEPLYATYEKEKALKPLFEHFNGKYSYGKLRLAMYLIEATVTIK
ncbi:helix-turn-helix domain-containing protein, partial [Nonlabens mediterrranea]|nr:helix-turn-helix domain-containing protein [Nonlabens mediterrranea]